MSRFLKCWAVILLALVNAGCGFHLRGSGPAAANSNLYLEGMANQAGFEPVFDRAVELAGGKSVSSIAKASGVIHVYQLLTQRRPLTLGAFGRANEFDLIYRLIFDIRSPKGEIISPRQEIELHRDYYNDQSVPLEQNEEEGLIRVEMQNEIANALVRRANYAISSAAEPKS